MIKVDSSDPDVCVVVPEPERLTAANATAFKDEMVALVESGRARFVIDMTQIAFVDSSGLGALVGVLKRVGNKGEIVVCGLGDSVRQMFRITRMDRVFAAYPNRAAAIAALKDTL